MWILIAAVIRVLTTGADDAAAIYAQSYERTECQTIRESQNGPWETWSIWDLPYDCPERIQAALANVADREGPGNYNPTRVWIGRHTGDSWAENRLHTKGHHRGILSDWCPAHWSPRGMSTSSTWGLMYVYNIHRLEIPGNCVPWQVFAFSFVAAKAAASHYVALCDPSRVPRWGWCPTIEDQKRSFRRRARRARAAKRRRYPA